MNSHMSRRNASRQDFPAENPTASPPSRPPPNSRASLALEIFDKWCVSRVNAIHNRPENGGGFQLPPGLFMFPECRWGVASLYSRHEIDDTHTEDRGGNENRLSKKEWDNLSTESLYERVPLLKEWKYRESEGGGLVKRLKDLVGEVEVAWPERRREIEEARRKEEAAKRSEEEVMIKELLERVRSMQTSTSRGPSWDGLLLELRHLVDDVETGWRKSQKENQIAISTTLRPRETPEQGRANQRVEDGEVATPGRISKAEIMRRKMMELNLPVTHLS